MEKQYFSLDAYENNKLTKIFRIIFGVFCLVVAIFWLIVNINSLKANWSPWITIIFLSGFGSYQIWSGFGYAVRFIEIGPDKIDLKKNAILPAVVIKPEEIEKIESFPLSQIFYLRSGKKIKLRFGTTYTDIIEPVKNRITNFASYYNIRIETKSEEL